MARCKAWRFVNRPGHPFGHMAGECRKCWKPCFKRVDRGERICDMCIESLSTHLDPQVRLELVRLSIPRDVLEMMSTDLDSAVSLAASEALVERFEPAPNFVNDLTVV